MVGGVTPMPAPSATSDLAQKAAAVNSVARARLNVTATLSREVAGSMAVCRHGDTVALHLFTPGGTRIFHLHEREFVFKARAPLDSNGNPFRTVAELTAKLDVAAPVPRANNNSGRSMPEGQLAAYQAAFGGFLSGHYRTKSAAFHAQPALPAHLYSAFVAWTLRKPQLDTAANYRRPVLKPNGKF